MNPSEAEEGTVSANGVLLHKGRGKPKGTRKLNGISATVPPLEPENGPLSMCHGFSVQREQGGS